MTSNQCAHTPGPWTSRRNAHDTAFRITDASGRLIAEPSWHSSNDTHFPLKPQSEANARLMAAAPELKDALVELLAAELAMFPSFDAGKEAQDAWADRRAAARNNARAVIAKATGATA